VSKFGVKEVFDITISSPDGLVTVIDTMKSMSIECRDGFGYLNIEDALVDVEFANRLFKGEFDNKYLRLRGYTYFRDANTGLDKRVDLTISTCKIDKFGIPFSVDNVATTDLTIRFPRRDFYGFPAMMLEVKDND